MSDRLKEHIQQNKQAFDTYEAPDLWTKIAEARLLQPRKILNLKNMLRYGFGASALAAATLVTSYYLRPQEEQAMVPVLVAPVQVSAPVITDGNSSGSLVLPGAIVPSVLTNEKSAAREPASDPGTDAPAENVQAPADAYVWTPEPAPEVPLPSSSDGTLTTIDTTFDNVKVLEVKATVCRVTIKGHSGKGLAVRGHVSQDGACRTVNNDKGWKNSEFVIKYERAGDVLRVSIEEVKLTEKVKMESVANDQNELDFTVPEGITIKAKNSFGSMSATDVNGHQLRMTNSSGNITLNNLKLDSIVISTSFGNVSAENLTGSVDMETSSGNISCMKVKGNTHCESSFGHQNLGEVTGKVRCTASSGNIKMEQVSGEVNATTSFGKQSYVNVIGPVNAKTSSGNVSVRDHKGDCNVNSSFGSQTFENVQGNITSQVQSGNISLEAVSGRLSLETSFGNIKGNDVQLSKDSDFKSTSGSISMALKNSMKELRFDLSTSSGKVTVEKENTINKSDRSLQVGDGKILVKGVSSFGNQIYK
jgi:DUF4097 and DUF4098 domain-containing protein YvlB